MSDQNDMLKLLYDNNQRLKQTETREVPGNVPGFSQFYDVGTFTPAYSGLTTAGVTTYTTQQGRWVRIGAAVFFTASIVWTAATGTGLAQFSLPFTTINTANQNYAIMVRTEAVTFANGSVQGLVLPNSAVMFLSSPITNGASTLSNVEAAGNIVYTGTIFVA